LIIEKYCSKATTKHTFCQEFCGGLSLHRTALPQEEPVFKPLTLYTETALQSSSDVISQNDLLPRHEAKPQSDESRSLYSHFLN